MLEVRPVSKARTLFEWYSYKEMIDMEPSYQRRGDLWPDKNKKLLINSVLNHYDVPKIYLADFTYLDTVLKENKKPYAIIDGKQRFSIFFDFFDGKISLDDSIIYSNNNELNLLGYLYADLKKEYPSLAMIFENYVPTVMSVISDDLAQLQEMFIRLNLNVSISGPERRNAMPGPLPALIRKLSTHKFFREYATFPINRGQDLNAAAKLLLFEDRHSFANSSKGDLDRFVTSKRIVPIKNCIPLYDASSLILDKLTAIFTKKDQLLKTQTQLPIYYFLAKKYHQELGPSIRCFLTEFEATRRLIHRESVARRKGQDVRISDLGILDYNNYIRSPDTKTRMEFMFQLLDSHLQTYLTSH